MSGYDLDGGTPEALATQAEYERLSQAASSLGGAQLDIAYGPHPRQKLDVFPAGRGAPVLVFYRGGYWKAGSKESRRFPALEWLPRGVSWVAVNYRLVPEARLADCVDDARASLAFLAANAGGLGLDAGQLHVVGNSAGGHLGAMLAAADWPDAPPILSVTGISGLYDLVPLLKAAPNDWLCLDHRSAQALSPINHLPDPGLRVALCCGADETRAFKDQMATYATACRANGNPVAVFECPGADHFRVIGHLGTPGTALFSQLERLTEEGP